MRCPPSPPHLPTDLRASWFYVRGPKGGKWLATFEKKKEVWTALNPAAEEELKKRLKKAMKEPSMEVIAMKKAMKAAKPAMKAAPAAAKPAAKPAKKKLLTE